MALERIVIVGAGPSGFATARAYRECGGTASVTLVGDESSPPYERPPLTKDLLRGELDVSELAIEHFDWFRERGLELRLGTAVTAIDRERSVAVLSDGEELRADAVVLATGSEPVRPDVPGMDHPDVLTMRRLADSLTLAARVAPEETVIVIGTGFIGCEIAGSLSLTGARVTLVGQEPLPQLQRLGRQAAQRIADWLAELGVELLGGVAVSAVYDGRVVELEDGRRLTGSCVVLGAGARPRGELADATDLEMSAGAVVVDETMRTAASSDDYDYDYDYDYDSPMILAVGDVAMAFNISAGRSLRVEHWGDALEHGEVAGRTLAGCSGGWNGVPGFWSTIGKRTLKYASWGDGYEEARLSAHPDGAFTVWYSSDGATVGVLTHECDADYEHGRELMRAKEPSP